MNRLTASLILMALAARCAAQQGPAPGSALPAVIPANYLGARSCSATACHANVTLASLQTIKGGEFIHWLENDPHALALETLDNDRSKAMLLRLKIRDEQGSIIDRPGYQNCLECHNVSAQLNPNSSAVHPDGVSCESCHGAARDWIDQHYTTTWHAMGPDQKSALGFNDTYTLDSRAAVCVTCHVGATDREVNHDMIAAGHPALKFEMSAYHDMLPKHWNHDGRGNWPPARAGMGRKAWPERKAGFELELWKKGQEEAARAALTLLAHRARNAKQGVWPELAEYDCFSCHHELKSPSWRQQSSRRGQLRWGSWYFANARATNTDVQELQDLMRASLSPDGDQVLNKAKSALASLPQFESGPPTRVDWDSMAQSYLASVAERVAKLDKIPKQPSDLAEDDVFQLQNLVRSMLSFPPEYDSPKGFDQGESLSSPPDPEAIQKKIEAIFSSLRHGEE